MISIIIPVFNEALNLAETLGSLRDPFAQYEVIVVDAQSSDGTRQVAEGGGARVVECAHRQRAAQMNAGAGLAKGEVLLFLHGDTRLPARGLQILRDAMLNQAAIGGGFSRRYDASSPMLRLTCILAEWRTRLFGWFLGDQAIFVRRSVFETLGGFQNWDQFEDLDFSRRMARMGRVVTLRPPVISSGRRFTSRGAVWTTWSDLRLTMRYLSGDRSVKARPTAPAAASDSVLAA